MAVPKKSKMKMAPKEKHNQGNKSWSNEELDVKWPAQCSNTAHHWVVTATLDGLFLYCKHCCAVQWLPSDLAQSLVLSDLMKKLGADEGYRWMLKHSPGAMRRMVVATKVSQLKDSGEIENILQAMMTIRLSL